jgi:hypothetical protein
MLGFAAVVAAIFVTGLAISDRLHLEGWERSVAAIVAGSALWLAATWLLALTHQLTRPALLGLCAAFLIAALFNVRRLHAPRVSLVLVPVALWVLFILWRGAIVPPVNHDVLAYHLPKAVLILRAHGIESFQAPDMRVAWFSSNYELLLADTLILCGADTITEWIGTAFYLAFLAASAWMAERWWGKGRHVAAVVVAVAGAPVLLLHSGADKNDLMAGFFAVTALLWGVRWARSGGDVPLALAIVSIVIAVGTKLNTAAVLLALLPLAVWRVARGGVRLVPALRTFLFGAAVFVFCGGAMLLIPRPATAAASAAPAVQQFSYGDWRNLVRVPVMILTVPFGPARAPFGGVAWPKYLVFGSHFGALFTIAAVALPFFVFAYRRRMAEATLALFVALVAFAIMLPVHVAPDLGFSAFPRYALFLLPVIVCWTIAPAVRALSGRMAHAAVAMVVAVFVGQAVDYGVNDDLCPLDYVEFCRTHPGTRIAGRTLRAAVAVDQWAGPHDVIAADGGTGSWVYPAYGAKLTRDVVFLHGDDVPPDAQWVIIDRGADYLATTGRFPPDPPLFVKLRNDPRFELVYHRDSTAQAVFRRR